MVFEGAFLEEFHQTALGDLLDLLLVEVGGCLLGLFDLDLACQLGLLLGDPTLSHIGVDMVVAVDVSGVDAGFVQGGVNGSLDHFESGLLDTHGQFLVFHLLRDGVFVEGDGSHGGDVECDVVSGFGSFLTGFVEAHEGGLVVAHVVVSLHVGGFEDEVVGAFDLLTGFAGHFDQFLGDGHAATVHVHEVFLRLDVGSHSLVEDAVGEVDEFLAFAHEVGFASHDEHVTFGSVGVGLGDDAAFVGRAVGAFGSHFLAFLAEDVASFFEVAFSLDEGLLAVHHTDTGLLS